MRTGSGLNDGKSAARLKGGVAPAYLFACLLLGGSAQGIWENMLLQLAGIAIMAWLAISTSDEPIAPSAKFLIYLAIAAVVLVILQMIPLPASLWDHGIRRRILDGSAPAGQAVLHPLSLTPYASLDALLKLIPPLALFCWLARHREYRSERLAWTLLAGTVAGIVLGLFQVAGGDNGRSYLYSETNIGLGVGFFANVNHMGDLLVVAIPFVASLVAQARTGFTQRSSTLMVVLPAIAILLLAGIALNHSLAAYGLAIPVCAASMLVLLKNGSPWRRIVIGIAGASMILSVAALVSSPVGATKFGRDAATSVQSRKQILATTGSAIRDFIPFGSGLGSFVKVYPLYERLDSVTTEYVIHAHDDYAELALELGVPGLILLLSFLGWWSKAVWRVWMRPGMSPMAKAASIASAAILIHSLVDYPLRTAAISACFAMCMALIADPKNAVRRDEGDLWPTRHLVIG